jgi:hypothetical protein
VSRVATDLGLDENRGVRRRRTSTPAAAMRRAALHLRPRSRRRPGYAWVVNDGGPGYADRFSEVGPGLLHREDDARRGPGRRDPPRAARRPDSVGGITRGSRAARAFWRRGGGRASHRGVADPCPRLGGRGGRPLPSPASPAPSGAGWRRFRAPSPAAFMRRALPAPVRALPCGDASAPSAAHVSSAEGHLQRMKKSARRSERKGSDVIVRSTLREGPLNLAEPTPASDLQGRGCSRRGFRSGGARVRRGPVAA